METLKSVTANPALYRTTLLSLVCIILVVTGCGDLVNAKSAAEEEITEFHQNYNSSKFELIYNNAHPALKEDSSFEEFNEFMTGVHRKLGPQRGIAAPLERGEFGWLHESAE